MTAQRNMRLNRKGKASSFSITVIVVIVVALLAAAGVIAYQQFTTTYAYVSGTTIPAGTKITTEMLDKKVVQRISVPKQFEGSGIVQDYAQIVGRYTQDDIKPGKMIFGYDLAPTYDIRVNPMLQENNYEAFTIKKGNFTAGASTNLVNVGDRINIYAVTTFDLSEIRSIKQNSALTGGSSYMGDGITTIGGSSSMTEDLLNQIGVKVSELPEEIKQICLDSGLDEDHMFYEETITIARLTWQNVPVINVIKTGTTAADTSLAEITLALDSETVEEMYVTMQNGGIAFTTLPYIEGEYTVIDNTGTTNLGIYEFGKAYK